MELRNGLLTASSYRGAWRVEENEEKKERRWEGERMGRREVKMRRTLSIIDTGF